MFQLTPKHGYSWDKTLHAAVWQSCPYCSLSRVSLSSSTACCILVFIALSTFFVLFISKDLHEHNHVDSLNFDDVIVYHMQCVHMTMCVHVYTHTSISSASMTYICIRPYVDAHQQRTSGGLS